MLQVLCVPNQISVRTRTKTEARRSKKILYKYFPIYSDLNCTCIFESVSVWFFRSGKIPKHKKKLYKMYIQKLNKTNS